MNHPFAPPVPVLHAISILEKSGHEAYLVGGCVRDMLLSHEPADWDVCTSAHPDAVKALFPGALETGLQHGTVTALMPVDTATQTPTDMPSTADARASTTKPVSSRFPIEITTFRADSDYRDHRHPDMVRFCSDLATDLSRRDFTINAMAWNPHSGLVDLFGGQKDLSAQLIRCVGDPLQRFGEDALRMLRAIRFCSQLSFSLHHDALLAIRYKREDILHVSGERISYEMTRTLTGKSPHMAALWWDTALNRLLFHPLQSSVADTEEGFQQIMGAIGRPSAIVISSEAMACFPEIAAWARLLCAAGLCHPPEALLSWMRRLHFPNLHINGVRKLVQLVFAPMPETRRNLRVAVSLHGKDWVDVALQIKHMLKEPAAMRSPLPDPFPLPGGTEVKVLLRGGWLPEGPAFGAFLESLRISRCEQPLFSSEEIPDEVILAMRAAAWRQKSGPVHSKE